MPSAAFTLGKYNGSPDCTIDRTFRAVFEFNDPRKNIRREKPYRAYRNPIYLAREWQALLNNGVYDCAADLARGMKTSRARVTQMLNILKLCPEVLEMLVSLGDPLPRPIVTERMIRTMVNAPTERQKRLA